MMIDEKTVSIPIEDAIKEFREAEPDIGEAYIIACLDRKMHKEISLLQRQQR